MSAMPLAAPRATRVALGAMFCLVPLGLTACGGAEAPSVASRRAIPSPPPSPILPVDHHVHVLGPDLLRDWKAIGATFSRADATYLTAESLLAPTGGPPAAVRRALLVPMAHLYGNSEFRAALGLTVERERELVARENDHVAREAARYPGRAVAFCSASALRPYALDELRRCHRELGSPGIKLHLASSEVDLRRDEHLAALSEIFAWAAREDLVVLVHLDPQRRGHTTADIERFASELLAPNPELRVIVAHLGGSGGYGSWTRSVFATLLDWLARRVEAGAAGPDLYFDLSAVILERESEGVPATTADEAAALGADLRRADPDRLVLGSDYPVFDPRRTVELLSERAGLTEREIDRLLGNSPRGLFPAEE